MEMSLVSILLLLLFSASGLTQYCDLRRWQVLSPPVALHEPLSSAIIDYVNRVRLSHSSPH